MCSSIFSLINLFVLDRNAEINYVLSKEEIKKIKPYKMLLSFYHYMVNFFSSP